MSSLYKLTENYAGKIEQLIDALESGNEISLDESVKMLDLQDDIKTKIVNIAKYVKSIEGESKTIAAEIARLNAAKKSRENKIARLKEVSLYAMELLKIESINDPIMPVKIVKNAGYSVSVENVQSLPDKFLKITYAADKRALLDAMGEQEIDGVTYHKGQHIRLG